MSDNEFKTAIAGQLLDQEAQINAQRGLITAILGALIETGTLPTALIENPKQAADILIFDPPTNEYEQEMHAKTRAAVLNILKAVPRKAKPNTEHPHSTI